MKRRQDKKSSFSWKLTLYLGVLGVACATPSFSLHAEGPPKAKSSYVKGQVIVKYKDSVTEPVELLLERRKELKQQGKSLESKKVFKMATTDGNDSLDNLHEKYKAHSARPLFRRNLKKDNPKSLKSLAAIKKHHKDKAAFVKKRFSRRAARAPKNTVTPDLSHIYVLEIPEDTDHEEFVSSLRRDPNVEWAQLNYVAEASLDLPEVNEPDDEFVTQDGNTWRQGTWGQNYPDLWGLMEIKALEAWNEFDNVVTDPGKDIVVAVVDTGVFYEHEDLFGNIWINLDEEPDNSTDDDNNGYEDDVYGWNFVHTNNNTLNDAIGHGTHVAGTIAAVGRNQRGIIGVAPKAKIMAVRALNDFAQGDAATLAEAIRYAADNGADIINNSWGWPSRNPENPVIEAAVKYAHGKGVVVVFAAGNEDDDVIYYSPQNQPETIVVSAINYGKQKADFSNSGLLVDVAAPGVDILSTHSFWELGEKACPGNTIVTGDFTNDYCHIDGTSMAAPHVSGVAALILARDKILHPDPEDPNLLTNEDVRQLIRVSADTESAAASNPNAKLPLIFIDDLGNDQGDACVGNTCLIYEKEDLTFDPLTITVTAWDPERVVSSLDSSRYNRPYGSTFTSGSADPNKMIGTFTWGEIYPGNPISFASLGKCSDTTYLAKFSARSGASPEVRSTNRSIAIKLVACGEGNPICGTTQNHPPIAKGYASPYWFNSGETFTLNGSSSCDPDGDGLTYNWVPVNSYPAGYMATIQNPSSAVTNATAPNVPSTQLVTLYFDLTVSDSQDSKTVKVTGFVWDYCFIATAAYGSSLSPELGILRGYRDEVLAQSWLGRAATKTYYKMSPPLAKFIKDKPLLRALTRQTLKPVIDFAREQLKEERSW